ncbi:MAG: glycosyltransferase family 2 protein [Acidimicrobiales bacterium]
MPVLPAPPSRAAGPDRWAQVKFRYARSEAGALEKLQYEFYYLRRQALAVDLRILVRTMRTVSPHGRCPMALVDLPVESRSSPRPARPVVTIAVPMLNEAGYIVSCLDSFCAGLPLDLLDVMVIDGGSSDGSRLVVEAYAAQHGHVRVVDNPTGSASSAFNIGMHQAAGQVVCLFSSHGVADPDYVSRSVEALHRSGASGVGGSYRHEGLDPVSNAIGAAMVSPVGMASPHRFAATARDVDTISHPAYWRDAMLEVGGFDETLLRNSDYEFNFRMRRQGHRLHLDPAIGSVYRPRPNLNSLFRQFWYYGKWKAMVAEQHPGSLRPRHLVAPAAVAVAAVTPAMLAERRLRVVAGLGWSAYAAVIAYGVASTDRKDREVSTATLAAAFPVMHMAWGAGFIKSVISRILGGSKR